MSTEKIVYGKLRAAGATMAGACGMLGNLLAESVMKTDNLENLCEKRLKENGVLDAKGRAYTDRTYTEAVDSGRITKEEFLHPLPGNQYGYGLAQWTSPDRKAGLYDLVKERGVSIADPETQADYLVQELQDRYKTVWQVLTTTSSVNAASDIVLKDFESPKGITDYVIEYRRSLSQDYYNQFLKEDNTMSKVTASKIIETAQEYIGCKESDGTHKKIIDEYNSHKPLARGYKVPYTAPWCDVFASVVAIKAGAVDLIGTECGCEEHIEIFKDLGIWEEDGTITPEPGDIIVYNWDDNTQPNDGYSDHIGYVETVSKGIVTVIEGNYKDGVGRRTIEVGEGQIRGYARPKYAAEKEEDTCTMELPILRKGDENRYVKNVQRLLRQKGYKKKNGDPIEPDGKYGPNTVAAVKRFQEKAKLKKAEPGVMDAKTWDRLLRSY